MRAKLLIIATAGLLCAADAKDDAVKKDMEKLQGRWLMVSSMRDGMAMPAEIVKTYSRIVKGNDYTVVAESEENLRVIKGTIKLDPTKKPKAIDATRTEGPDKGKPMLGIYEFDGDKQKVCFAPVGKERPTEFVSKPGTEHVLTIWKRADDKNPKEPKSTGRAESSTGNTVEKSAVLANGKSLRQIVDECNRKSIEDFKKGDMLAVARGYTDDATIYFPRGKKVHGREAIDRYWQGLKGAKDWKLETIEVGGTREAIYEVGKSSLTTEVDGKADSYVCDYVVIWKRQKDGSYRAHTDIFN
jgi:uncharacterized protein (TIGR03067 family)